MKSLLYLLTEALKDLGAWCSVSTTRDIHYISGRFEHEGLPFIAVRLASFGKDFQKSLSLGYVADDSFLGFKKRAGLPELFRGFLLQVFDRAGVLLPDPDIDCIFAVRQLTLMCEKVRVEYTDEVTLAAMNGYLESERNVKELDRKIVSGNMDDQLALFEQVFTLLWGDVLTNVESDLLNGRLVPRHGPGATADKLLGNSKWSQSEWPERLDEYFPHQEYLVPSLRYWREATEHAAFLPLGAEKPVKVITVPKTVGKARIIAMEPTAMQYCQQALDRSIRKHMTSSFASRFVDLRHQEPNQLMALRGSLDGSLATLDLSAASDSLSNQLVIIATRKWSHLSGAIQACRSRRADVQGEIIRLSKFASMGSALCFPLETMVFVTLSVIGSLVDMGQSCETRLARGPVKGLSGLVRSYGDDIVVPTDRAQQVMRWLEAFGFQVNEDKSYWTGKFRESCGRDYYDGIDVSVVRVREPITTSPRHAGVGSTVSLRNHLYERGMWHTATWLDHLLEKSFRGHYPVVMSTSAVLGRHSFLGYETERLSGDTQSPQVLGYIERSVLPASPLDGIPALMKVLSQAEEEERSGLSWIFSNPKFDDDHLQRGGRSSTVYTKLRWATPF